MLRIQELFEEERDSIATSYTTPLQPLAPKSSIFESIRNRANYIKDAAKIKMGFESDPDVAENVIDAVLYVLQGILQLAWSKHEPDYFESLSDEQKQSLEDLKENLIYMAKTIDKPLCFEPEDLWIFNGIGSPKDDLFNQTKKYGSLTLSTLFTEFAKAKGITSEQTNVWDIIRLAYVNLVASKSVDEARVNETMDKLSSRYTNLKAVDTLAAERAAAKQETEAQKTKVFDSNEVDPGYAKLRQTLLDRLVELQNRVTPAPAMQFRNKIDLFLRDPKLDPAYSSIRATYKNDYNHIANTISNLTIETPFTKEILEIKAPFSIEVLEELAKAESKKGTIISGRRVPCGSKQKEAITELIKHLGAQPLKEAPQSLKTEKSFRQYQEQRPKTRQDDNLPAGGTYGSIKPRPPGRKTDA